MKEFFNKIIYIIGIILLFVVFILNIFFSGNMWVTERVVINHNSILFVVSAILLALAILVISKVINEKKIKTKKILFVILIIVYVCTSIIYINYRKNKNPVYDQETVYRFAVAMKEGKTEEVGNERNNVILDTNNLNYFSKYQQQLTIVFLWKTLFNIFNTTSITFIRYLNLLGNILSLTSIILICKELSKKYKVNKSLGIILFCTFLALIYLVTFVYGDIIGLGLSMVGVYFIMKYGVEKKIRYAFISAIFMSLAYMFRMNYLIFILAMLVYLFLDLIDKNNYLVSKDKSKKIVKKVFTKILVMLCFITIVFVPANMVINYYCNKLGLDKEEKFLVLGYLYMGMNESPYSARMV